MITIDSYITKYFTKYFIFGNYNPFLFAYYVKKHLPVGKLRFSDFSLFLETNTLLFLI